MITHFTYQPFSLRNRAAREYQFSFFYKGVQYRGIYHYNGLINWEKEPEESDIKELISRVHEFMLFHVYE